MSLDNFLEVLPSNFAPILLMSTMLPFQQIQISIQGNTRRNTPHGGTVEYQAREYIKSYW